MAEKTSVSLFETEVIGTARSFSRDGNIKVVFQGDSAKTNDDTIIFPALDHTKPLTQEQVAIGRGYVDHEAAHLRHTDMPLFQAMASEAKARGDRLFSMMVNAVEDVRIEKITIDEFPGAMKNLIATTEEVCRHFIQEQGENEKVFDDLKAIGPIALTWVDRKRRGYIGEYLDKCIEKLSPRVKATVDGWALVAKEMSGLTKREVAGAIVSNGRPGTKEAIALAKRFVGETRNPTPGKDEDEGDEEPKGGVPGEGEGDGDGDTETEVEISEPQEEYEVKATMETGTTTGEASGRPGGVGAGSGKQAWVDDPSLDYSKEPEVMDVGINIERSFATHTGETASAKGYRPFSTADDKWHFRKDLTSKYMIAGSSASRARVMRAADGDTTYAKTMREAGSKVSVMRRKLERALLSKAMRGWDTGKEDGRLDSRRLTLAARGHTNVFKAREEVPEVDTAVEILIDLSGSMSGSKAQLAMQSAILLCEALDGTGVAYEVTGFNSTTGWTIERKNALIEAHNVGQLFSRTEPLDIYVFKSFDETLREGKRSMGNITRCVGGNNCDGESVELAYNRLAKRVEKRHILLVLSDGYPAVGTDFSNQLNTHLRKVVKEIEGKHNTQIVGLGIQSDSVKQFYSHWCLVEHLEDLSKNVLDQVGRMLLGERFIVDNGELIGGKTTKKRA